MKIMTNCANTAAYRRYATQQQLTTVPKDANTTQPNFKGGRIRCKEYPQYVQIIEEALNGNDSFMSTVGKYNWHAVLNTAVVSKEFGQSKATSNLLLYFSPKTHNFMKKLLTIFKKEPLEIALPPITNESVISVRDSVSALAAKIDKVKFETIS